MLNDNLTIIVAWCFLLFFFTARIIVSLSVIVIFSDFIVFELLGFLLPREEYIKHGNVCHALKFI